jgi:hypothetical protein
LAYQEFQEMHVKFTEATYHSEARVSQHETTPPFECYAADYELCTNRSIMEALTLARKVMQLSKQGNSRQATSSLARLTEHFVGRTLNKSKCQIGPSVHSPQNKWNTQQWTVWSHCLLSKWFLMWLGPDSLDFSRRALER